MQSISTMYSSLAPKRTFPSKSRYNTIPQVPSIQDYLKDSLGKTNMADMGRRLSCLLQTLPVYLRLSNQVVLNRWHKKSDPKAALLNKYNNVFYPTKKVSTNEYNCSSVRLSVPTLSINAYSSFFPVITNLCSFPSTSHKR